MTEPATGTQPTPEAPATRWPVRPRTLAAGAVLLALLAVGPLVRYVVPVEVQSHPVTRGVVASSVYGRGTVEARREAQLGFDLAGRVVSVLVDEGDRVTVGQELARLDPEQYEAALRTAASSVEATRATLVRLAAEQRLARTALDLAEREELRVEALVKSGVSPSQELDLARDQRLLGRDAVERVQAQIAEASRSVEVARGSAEQSRVTAVRAIILAPFDGYVARRFRDPGDTVAIGATVLRLVDTESAQVEAWVDETALPRLAIGQAVTLRFPGLAAESPGRLVRIGTEADRQTHELQVDIAVDPWPGRFVVGQRADVWIEADRRTETIPLPTGLVRRDAAGTFAYVDRDGRIARVTIGLGLVGTDVVEVLSGLEPGDVALDAPAPGGSLPLGRRWKALP